MVASLLIRPVGRSQMTNLQRILAGIFLAARQGGGGGVLLLLLVIPFFAAIAIAIAVPFLTVFVLIKALELIPALTNKGIQKQC
jgi:hypothetical protein